MKDELYEQLQKELKGIPSSDMLIVMGDSNVEESEDNEGLGYHVNGRHIKVSARHQSDEKGGCHQRPPSCTGKGEVKLCRAKREKLGDQQVKEQFCNEVRNRFGALAYHKNNSHKDDGFGCK
ncbi:hypothetical protein ACROYT_G026286 [Oculina patagonica]